MGLDQATMRMSLDYGVSETIALGLAKTHFRKLMKRQQGKKC